MRLNARTKPQLSEVEVQAMVAASAAQIGHTLLETAPYPCGLIVTSVERCEADESLYEPGELFTFNPEYAQVLIWHGSNGEETRLVIIDEKSAQDLDLTVYKLLDHTHERQIAEIRVKPDGYFDAEDLLNHKRYQGSSYSWPHPTSIDLSVDATGIVAHFKVGLKTHS